MSAARHISLGQLLAQAADQGLYRLTLVTIQIPAARNDWQAIVWCEVRLYAHGESPTYAAFGDAHPNDTHVSHAGPKRLSALLARAEYRAKRAALTRALNLPDTLNTRDTSAPGPDNTDMENQP